MTKARINSPSFLFCAVALLVASGCVGEPYEVCPEDQRIRIDQSEARIWPPVVHTGYNGRDTFLAPIATNYVVDAWTSNDPRTASVAGYPICGAPSILDPSGLVIAESVGSTDVSATALDIDGQSFTMTVQIQIEPYTEEDTDLGETRYQTGEGNGLRRSCASCHDNNGIDHTPLEMAFHDDNAILTATKEGKYPDICSNMVGDRCDCLDPACDGPVSTGYQLSVEHSWELTPDEERGIIAYMRSLRPVGL